MTTVSSYTANESTVVAIPRGPQGPANIGGLTGAVVIPSPTKITVRLEGISGTATVTPSPSKVTITLSVN